MDSQFLEIVQSLATVDVRTTPNYKTAKAIANHPNAKFPNPVETAFAIEMEVNEDFVNDSDFQTVVDAYVNTLNRIYAQMCDDFPKQADAIFNRMATKLSLKYSY